MIISIFAAMPLEANAWVISAIKDKPHASRFEDIASWAKVSYSDGTLSFYRPDGRWSKEETDQVDYSVSWYETDYDNGWWCMTGHMKTPTPVNTIEIGEYFKEHKFPSGSYKFTAKDPYHHTYEREESTYIDRIIEVRYCSDYFTYISPYKRLDTPSSLSLENNVASWQAVPHADEYTVTLCLPTGEYQTSATTSSTSFDFSKYHPYGGCYFTVRATSNGNYCDSRLAISSPINYGTLWYMPNGGTGSKVPVTATGNYVLAKNSMGIGAPSGYEFVGWSLTENGSEMVSSVQINEETEVYAIWKKAAGSIDPNVFWRLDGTTLYIYGEGAILNRTEGYPNPSLFRNNTEITRVVIGDGITQIGDWFFDGCTNLKTLDLSNANSLYRIGVHAFNNCSNLSLINYPSRLGVSVNQIGAGAFKNCSSLTSFQLSENDSETDPTQYIGAFAFGGCTSLRSVSVPQSITGLAYNAFENCDSLEAVFYGGSEEEWAVLSADCAELANVPVYEYSSWGAPVGEDAMFVADAFGQTGRIFGTGETWDFLYKTSPVCRSSVEEIIVEDGITHIGDRLFNDCDDIKKVTLPSSLDYIGQYMCSDCDNLETVVIPNSVEWIDQFAFAGCTKLKRVFLGSGLETIDWAAFAYDEALEKVYYIESQETFYERVHVDGNNDPLGNATFCALSGACGPCHAYMFEPETATLTIYGSGAMDDYGIHDMPWYEFRDEIREVVINNGVTTVGEDAFWEFENIEKVTLPDSMETIVKYAFSGCEKLAEINLPENLKSIGNQALSGTALTYVMIPSGIQKISASTFSYCESLETVYLPKSVKTIAGAAFYKCTALKEIYYEGTEDELNAIEIGDMNDPLYNATVYLNTADPNSDIFFPDVKEGAWYYEAVQYVAKKGYMGGYSNGKFGPADKLKRQDFVMILSRIANADLSSYENAASKFSDVKKGSYYFTAVMWAVDNGIIGGYSNGKFGVGDNITREQVATILYRYMGSPEVQDVDSTLAKYKDVNRISAYAKIPLAWAVQSGIISGMADGRIAPVEGASRAQIAQIVMRMDQQGMFVIT